MDVGPADWWDHAGVLSTAGGLVFQGTGSGHFRAYDAKTGELLKDIDVGTTIVAAPMSYEIDGVQYIAVMAAWGGEDGASPIPRPHRTSAAMRGASSRSNSMAAPRRFLRSFRRLDRYRSLRH